MAESRLTRLHRRIVASGRPQALVCQQGKFDLFDADSPRLDAMLKTSDWSGRVLGVFTPDVPIEVLREEVFA